MSEEPKQSTKEKELRRDTFIPDKYQALFDAVEAVGKALYPDDWTGGERRYTGARDYHARSDLEQELRDTIERAAHDLARKDKKYLQTIPKGKFGTTRIPNDEAFRVARENPKIGTELRTKISVMVARRDDIEDACLKALYNPNSNLAPKCPSHFKQNDGSLTLFNASLWGTPEGKRAVRSEFPGCYNTGKELSILIADGVLATVVVEMMGEKHENHRAVKTSTKNQITINILNELFPDKDPGGFTNDQILVRVKERLVPGVTISDATFKNAKAQWLK